jgi:pimeloyl-ACP methyl ester carboxylesterase
VGDADAPLILFLHGFPEYSGAWEEVLPAFADRFHAVAPDQRGYALSGKPVGLEADRIKQLPRDVLALADRLSPDRPFSIVAHDWGASVAYATAIAAPRRVARLVVLNGVHPGPFQRALAEAEAQRAARAYMHELRHPQAEERLSANRYEKLLGMLSRLGPQPWLSRQSGRLPRRLVGTGCPDGHAQLVSGNAPAGAQSRRARRSCRAAQARSRTGCACACRTC